MTDSSSNGNGLSGPVPVWHLDRDTKLEDELAIRAARLAGLDRRAAEEGGDR